MGILTAFGIKLLMSPLFMKICLAIEEDIIPYLLLASKNMVSISLFISELVSAICFSYSKSIVDLKPLKIKLAFSFLAKSTSSIVSQS